MYKLWEDENGPFWWKVCEVNGCENMVCKGLSSKYCFPHSMTGGGKTLVAPTKRTKKKEYAEHE